MSTQVLHLSIMWRTNTRLCKDREPAAGHIRRESRLVARPDFTGEISETPIRINRTNTKAQA